MERARIHHAQASKRACLNMWKAHHAEWKQHWIALLHYHTQLERHMLRKWHAQVALRMRIRAMRRTVLLRAARTLIYSAFSAWRSYVRNRNQLADVQTTAMTYTNLNSLRRSVPFLLLFFLFFPSFPFFFVCLFLFPTLFTLFKSMLNIKHKTIEG